jgi:hypothetical protein|tara:strand:+ start:783 stop:1070 length:288 start_codon:yes stop_codon:yes gene_type:complete
MDKFNTVTITRVVENTHGCDTDEDVVLAMLNDDKCIVSTMTIHLPTEIESNSSLVTLGLVPVTQLKNLKFTPKEWKYYIGEDYPGWVVSSHYNKK